MFFFMSYDGYRDRRRETAQTLTSIPTAAEHNGDFSALPVTIYDPRTTRPNPNGTGSVRDPFPGNIIPSDRISSISRYFQSFLPAPTSGGLQNNYLGGALPTGFNNENVTGKVDVKAGERQQLSVLFSHGKRSQATPYRGGTNPQTALPLPYTRRALSKKPPRARRSSTHTSRSDVGESGQYRLLAAVSADFQRDDRRAVSDQGGPDRTAGR